uniref:Uncharacterized protein n=1 Tax=Arundo donax TaxID=35708 RepID=A0A0A8YX15_ARUDO
MPSAGGSTPSKLPPPSQALEKRWSWERSRYSSNNSLLWLLRWREWR